MAHTEQLLVEIRGALDQLSRTARTEQDASRCAVARNLAATFSGVMDRAALREAARESLPLFRGGMGSFQDVGTAPMADAVQRLQPCPGHHSAGDRASTRISTPVMAAVSVGVLVLGIVRAANA